MALAEATGANGNAQTERARFLSANCFHVSYCENRFMSQQPVLIDGQWRESAAEGSFQAENPATQACLPEKYPISSWADCEAALHAAHRAAQEMKSLSGDALAAFLDHYAANIE